MLDNHDMKLPNHDDDRANATTEYLNKASAACDAGDARLGMHLYLAAFEEASVASDIVSEDALLGLKKAWAIACKFKERSLAEHIFEKMEPYLSQAELTACVAQLQTLALDRLEEFGVSREDLEGMAQAITQEIMGAGEGLTLSGDVIPKIVRVEHFKMDGPVSLPAGITPGASLDAESVLPDGFIDASGVIDASSFEFPSIEEFSSEIAAQEIAELQPADGHAGGIAAESLAADQASVSEQMPSDAQVIADAQASPDTPLPVDGQTGVDAQAAQTPRSGALPPAKPSAPRPAATLASSSAKPVVPAEASAESPAEFFAKAVQDMGVKLVDEERPLNYDNLAGFDSTIAAMRDLGIGLHDDPEFASLVGLLNSRHGLSSQPPLDSFLFRAVAREDAGRFAAATVGEFGKPALRMHMEEGLQGQLMLCVTAQTNEPLRSGNLRKIFADGGTLVLENIDLWMPPQLEEGDGSAAQFIQALSRGAREAIGLIRAAVDNPDVLVLATASMDCQIDGFFLDMLEPICLIDINNPTPEERVDIWMDIAREHPSMRGVNRADLVRLSANLPRFDIYMAAREAIEEAYKLGLVTRRYQPVTRDNLFDKLAAYQPLDSDEYHSLEDEVVRDFRRGFDDLEDALFRTGH